jgi:hypothetical protein
MTQSIPAEIYDRGRVLPKLCEDFEARGQVAGAPA